MTLPGPPTRNKNLENNNLPLEFYFPDSLLLELDSHTDSRIFSKTSYIRDGEIKRESKHAVQILIDSNDLTNVHRKIDGPGKDRLVEQLPDLPVEEFEEFDCLFRIIAEHLVPDHEFVPRDATQDIKSDL